MLIAGSQKYIYTAEDNILRTFNAADLTQVRQVSLDGAISSLCCNTVVVSGTRSGSLYTVAAGQPRILRQFKSSISALFLKGSILGVGTEGGTVCVILVKDTELVVLEEREHTAPVLGIITDGVTTYISDMRNRICVFPDQKIYDNFNTHICYSRYLFASESVFLYCKTKEAFAVCLEHCTGNEIQKFLFSRTGSVLLVKEESRVFVYDFNKREVINEIGVSRDFVYDEDRNRLVVEGRELTTIDNVADRDLLGRAMDDVFFKESSIEERIVWSESDCSDEVLRIKRKKKKNVSYRFVAKDTETKSSEVSLASHREKDRERKKQHSPRDIQTEMRPTQKATLNALFEDTPPNEQQKHAVHIQSSQEESVIAADMQRRAQCKREPFVSSSIKCNGSHLMCYNTFGYLISTKDEFYSLVELRYHDNSRNGMKIKDTNFCTMGVFFAGAVLLAASESLHFYSENIEWAHKSPEEVTLIGISEAILGVVYKQGVLRIYKHSGLELFNCEFEAVDSICCYKQSAVVLCGRSLCRVDSATFACERFEILSGANWIHVDVHIHYRAASNVYILNNGLSLKVAELDNVPLCVSNGYLLALSRNVRLYPEPSVEYFKMRLEHNSSCPNILNSVVFDRDEDQLVKIAKEAEDLGRTRLADDVRALLVDSKGVAAKNETLLRAADTKNGAPVHYREKENERWAYLDSPDNVGLGDSKSAMVGEIKTKKYSPFKK